MSLLAFVAGITVGAVAVFLLAVIFDFDVKIEFITGKSARSHK